MDQKTLGGPGHRDPVNTTQSLLTPVSLAKGLSQEVAGITGTEGGLGPSGGRLTDVAHSEVCSWLAVTRTQLGIMADRIC